MVKRAVFAAAMLAAASVTWGSSPALDTVAVPAAEPACHLVQSLDPGCALRSADANGDGTISAAELASVAPTAVGLDFASLVPHSTGLDFKDAATDPTSILPVTLERDTPQPLVPALLALGAMVVLLRRRPAGF